MNRRQPLVIALIWLVTVAGASTLTWGVISSAGTQVGQPVPVTPAALATRTASPSAVQPSATPSSTPSEHPSQTTKPTSTSKPNPTKTTEHPSTLSASWSGDAGKVTASCTGTRIAFVSAVPSDGYKVQYEKEGTGRLKVEFEQTGSEDEEHETHLSATCTDGKPVFHRD